MPAALFMLGLLLAVGPNAQPAPIQLWRLDCGTMEIPDLSYFSDSFDYDGKKGVAANGCFLVRHGDQYLLWEAGLPADYLGKVVVGAGGWRTSLKQSIAAQLKKIGLTPGKIGFLAVSHSHSDHVGQANDFAHATLLMHEEEHKRIRRARKGNAIRRLAPWFSAGSNIKQFKGDLDVFGDGRVMILALPGHTEGHTGLLVRLAKAGDVLISGDLYHFHSEIASGVVSKWNVSRADTLASMARFERIIRLLRPRVIVQHDPADVSAMPSFPAALD